MGSAEHGPGLKRGSGRDDRQGPGIDGGIDGEEREAFLQSQNQNIGHSLVSVG